MHMDTGSMPRGARLTMALLALGAIAAGCGRDDGAEVVGVAVERSGGGTQTCVTIQRGGVGDIADAHLADDKPTKNYGGSGSLTAGAVSPGQRLALVRYDLSAIPQG